MLKHLHYWRQWESKFSRRYLTLRISRLKPVVKHVFRINSVSVSSAKKNGIRWLDLNQNLRMAWEALGYTQNSWDVAETHPKLCLWDNLSSAQQSAVKHGLSMKAEDWDEFVLDLLKSSPIGNSDSPAFVQSPDTSQESLSNTNQIRSSPTSIVARSALATLWTSVKIVAPILHLLGKEARGNSGLKLHPALKLAAQMATHVPGLVEEFSPPVEITGVETVVYLDDSGSMESLLSLGQEVLRVMADSLHHSTRVMKFGSSKTVLSARDDNWSTAITMLGWNATSGSTYMWKMIEEDIMGRYRPGQANMGLNGKIRVVVITDGADTDSPGSYRGMQGMDPMMKTLLSNGYDIEWHIVILSQPDFFGLFQPFDRNGIRRYESLAAATGGSCIQVASSSSFDPSDGKVAKFLAILEDSGHSGAKERSNRSARQIKYKDKVRSGKAENFDWIKLLPGNK